MKSLGVAVIMFAMLLTLGVTSVYANTAEGTVALPILGTTGAPALAAPSLFSGAISVLYADGTPAVLSTNQVTLNVCNTSCVTVTATLKQTAPGTYTYSFTPPTSLTGTVTIYIKAYGLADDNGRIFPSVDTSIGTYAYAPSTTTGTSAPIGTTNAPPAGTPVSPLTQQAVDTVQTPTQTFPIAALLAVLSAFALAGCLLILPSRH
ncbi:MAG: hypothetical protein ACLP9D_09645 [Candidatus Bathyarchaeia archaeon]